MVPTGETLTFFIGLVGEMLHFYIGAFTTQRFFPTQILILLDFMIVFINNPFRSQVAC